MLKVEMIDRLCVILHSNMTSFFRFANKRAIYLDGKISLAHARHTHKPGDKITKLNYLHGC